MNALFCFFSVIDKGSEISVKIEKVRELKFMEIVREVDEMDSEMSDSASQILGRLGRSLIG